MIVTGGDLEAARKRLGWSVYEMARALRLTGDREQSGKRIRELESGRRDLSGPICVAVEAFVDGWRPEGWRDE